MSSWILIFAGSGDMTIPNRYPVLLNALEPRVFSFADRGLMNKSITTGKTSEALSLDQLQVYFQPLVNLRSGKITGLEAHPCCMNHEGSILSEAGLLALAARLDQEADIDHYLLEMAVQGNNALCKVLTAPVMIAVNLTSTLLARTDTLAVLDKRK